MSKEIEIVNKIYIKEDELVFKASRSSGPGGQNVNKLNTKISLFLNIKDSTSFSDSQKELILKRLAGRIDKYGFIRIVSQKFRSQQANKIAAVERLQKLLSDALKVETVRKKTKVTYASKQKRLERKKYKSKLKKQRTDKDFDF
jgi:ribosome-associated protein